MGDSRIQAVAFVAKGSCLVALEMGQNPWPMFIFLSLLLIMLTYYIYSIWSLFKSSIIIIYDLMSFFGYPTASHKKNILQWRRRQGTCHPSVLALRVRKPDRTAQHGAVVWVPHRSPNDGPNDGPWGPQATGCQGDASIADFTVNPSELCFFYGTCDVYHVVYQTVRFSGWPSTKKNKIRPWLGMVCKSESLQINHGFIHHQSYKYIIISNYKVITSVSIYLYIHIYI